MEHFLLMASNLDTRPLLYAVSRQPGLWDQHTLRTTHPGTPHSQVSDIWLRFNDTSEYEATGNASSIVDGHESVPYPAWFCLPEVRPLVFGLMSRVQATRLGRCLITKLRPGCRIAPHKDSAPHSVYYQRFHVTLCTPAQCYFRIEDEVLNLPEGSCYYVNNAVEHEVWNDGPTERIALIIDLHSDPTPPPPAGVSGGALRAYYPETVPLWRQHYTEVANDQDVIALDPDVDKYAWLDAQAMLHIVTARVDGQLVGYFTALVMGHLHYASTLHAMTDMYYLLPAWRKGRNALKLFGTAHRTLKARGVVKIASGTKLHAGLDMSRLFAFMGYRQTEALFTKLL